MPERCEIRARAPRSLGRTRRALAERLIQFPHKQDGDTITKLILFLPPPRAVSVPICMFCFVGFFSLFSPLQS